MFQGIIIRSEPAFRPRPAVLPGYHKFSQGQYDAFVAVSALDHISYEAQQASPNETIGYLVGRPFRDTKGIYAVVTDAIPATSARRGQATVETTLEDEQQLLDTLREKHPISEKLGWFHSHPFPMPSYSGTDARNQQFWSEPYHLGLLATLECESDTVSIHAFRGPESERLQPPYTAADQITKDFSVPAAAFQPLPRPIASSHARRWCRCNRQLLRRWSSLVTTSIVVVIIWPIVYLIGVWMIIQSTRGNAAQAAKDIRALRPAAESKRIDPQDIRDLSLPERETAGINGSGKKLHTELQAGKERPQKENLRSPVLAVTTDFVRGLGKHASPQTDGRGVVAEPHNTPNGRPAADASINATKK